MQEEKCATVYEEQCYQEPEKQCHPVPSQVLHTISLTIFLMPILEMSRDLHRGVSACPRPRVQDSV